MITPGTPLPWKIIPTPQAEIRIGYNVQGNWLASVWSDASDEALIAEAEADAAYIVHACNLYPELLEAAQKALNYIANTESELGITLGSGDVLRAAIAKADAA